MLFNKKKASANYLWYGKIAIFCLFHIMRPSIIGQNNGELDLRCY